MSEPCHSCGFIPHSHEVTQLTRDQLTAIACRMEDQGSHFASAIGTAYIYADGGNKRKLLDAFGDVFMHYKED